MDKLFREYINADDLQDSGQILVQAAGLIENGHHQVGADGDPDLRLHGVLAGAEEGLDSEVLLDPFEEELDLPASLVDLRRHKSFEFKVASEKHERFSSIRIHIADTPQVRSVQAFSLRSVEPDGPVGSKPGRLVERTIPKIWARRDRRAAA